MCTLAAVSVLMAEAGMNGKALLKHLGTTESWKGEWKGAVSTLLSSIQPDSRSYASISAADSNCPVSASLSLRCSTHCLLCLKDFSLGEQDVVLVEIYFLTVCLACTCQSSIFPPGPTPDPNLFSQSSYSHCLAYGLECRLKCFNWYIK